MATRPGPEDATTSRNPIRPFLPPAPRVSQVDAVDLDEGLVGMLAEKIERSIGNLRFGIATDLKPEITLAIKLVIFQFSYFGPSRRASPGAKLQNLKLIQDGAQGSKSTVTRGTLLLYLLLHPPMFPSYLLTRIRTYALSQQWPDLPSHDSRRRAWRAITGAEIASRVWELAGWACFLWDKRYPSLLMRMLKIRLVPASSQLTRLVSYEFMNRQLVWSAFTDIISEWRCDGLLYDLLSRLTPQEFLLFAIPLLPAIPQTASLRPAINNVLAIFNQPTFIDYNSIPLLPPASSAERSSVTSRQAHSGPLARLPLDTCPICYVRQTSALAPLGSIGAGANISLPHLDPYNRGGTGALASGEVSDGAIGGETVDDESRIFVPAQSDCWGGCRWCYYCIGEKLAEFCEQQEAKDKKSGIGPRAHSQAKEKPVEAKTNGSTNVPQLPARSGANEEKWSCLRCGGGVSRAWRVGPT